MPRSDPSLAMDAAAAGARADPASRGLALGLLAVLIFALTLPMTRLAMGDAGDPQLSPAFWVCARAGCALVLLFAVLQGGGRLIAADAWLLLAVASAAVGYVGGARAAAAMPAEQVICWVLVGSLPLTLPLALWWWPAQPVGAGAWLGFGYVALFSMWLGFFAWYRALALGGVVRVSQVQLLQPFLALIFAVPLLGEPLEPLTLGFALAVVAIVFIGRRMSAPGRSQALIPERAARRVVQ